MSFDKFLSKAKNLANDPKVRDKLNSDKAEKVSDSILDKAAGAADSLTKGKHRDRIQNARDAADRAVGTDGSAGTGDPGRADSPGRADGPAPRGPGSRHDSRVEGHGDEPRDPRDDANGPRSH